MGGRMWKEQGFELAGISLQRIWWMLWAETKPLPLKDSKGTHALKGGWWDLLSLLNGWIWLWDPGARLRTWGPNESCGWERYSRPCDCEGNPAGDGFDGEKDCMNDRQLPWLCYMTPWLFCWLVERSVEGLCREIWRGWMDGLKTTLEGSVRPSARSCTWVTTIPHSTPGFRKSGWEAAWQKSIWGCWSRASWPWSRMSHWPRRQTAFWPGSAILWPVGAGQRLLLHTHHCWGHTSSAVSSSGTHTAGVCPENERESYSEGSRY